MHQLAWFRTVSKAFCTELVIIDSRVIGCCTTLRRVSGSLIPSVNDSFHMPGAIENTDRLGVTNASSPYLYIIDTSVTSRFQY